MEHGPRIRIRRRVRPVPRTTTELLHDALWKHDLDAAVVYDLLNQGASPAAVNLYGWTALHVAASRNAAGIIPSLVTDANLDSFGSGPIQETPLMLAAAAGHTRAVDALLAAGADVRCCTLTGRTALGDALAGGHYLVALRLWERAQQCADCDAIRAAAVTAAPPALDALATAVKQGWHQLVPLLVTPAILNHKTGNGEWTPLHLALQQSDLRAAQALLDAGAAVTIPDGKGLIPLAYVVQRKEPQLSVRILQLMKQQQPATAAEGDLMEAVIAVAAGLTIKAKLAHSGARLFAAVMAAWGHSAAADLLQGVLKHFGATPHHLAETLLVAWRQAQQEQLLTHALLARLQRLVLDAPTSSHQQQQLQQQQLPKPKQDRALCLRLPLALLQDSAGVGQGPAAGSATKPAIDASLAVQMEDVSNRPWQAHPIAEAARRGSMREVAALLAAVPPADLPAALLVAAQAAGSCGHTSLCNATLQRFAALDWQAAGLAPYAPLIRAAATGASAGKRRHRAAARLTQQGQQQQEEGSPGSGAGFCLYRALLNSWVTVPLMVGRELAAQVVEAVERATAQARLWGMALAT